MKKLIIIAALLPCMANAQAPIMLRHADSTAVSLHLPQSRTSRTLSKMGSVFVAVAATSALFGAYIHPDKPMTYCITIPAAFGFSGLTLMTIGDNIR